MSEVRPVQADPPLQQQQFINPKTGTLTDYGHRVLYALWSRSGEFDDDTYNALFLGFTAASQNADLSRRFSAIDDATSALRADLNGLRGDARLAKAEGADQRADDAFTLAMSRAPAGVMRRLDEMDQTIASVVNAVSELRSTVQRASAQLSETAQDQIVQTGFFSQIMSSYNSRLTQTTINLEGEIDTVDDNLETRAKAALSGVSPVSYNSTSGAIALNASMTSLGTVTTAANKGYYTTGADTWASADLTSFGRSVWALADAAAGRTLLGLGTLATLNTINDSNWSGADLDIANGGTGASTASAARTNLGLVIGTNVQAYNLNLASLAGLTLAANKLLYSTGANTLAMLDFTPGAWNAYTPTVTSASGSLTSYTASGEWARIGKIYHFWVLVTLTDAGTGAGGLQITLPTTAATIATFNGAETAATGIQLQGRVSVASNILTVVRYDNATIIATGRTIRMSGTYQSQ